MTPIRLAIHGAGGRMGQRLVALASADPEFKLVGALEAPFHPQIGRDVGALSGIGDIGLKLSTEWPEHIDVMIDFSMPEASVKLVEQCAARAVPVVLATTGFSPEERVRIAAAAHLTALLSSPSMSPAVNLCMKLASITGAALKSHPAGVDVEILERHHRMKEDAPSGTALKFGEVIAAAMGQTEHRHGREGRIGKRPANEIGYHAIRTGDNPGEHTLIFGIPGETIEITVRASNRDCYANGALMAAKFLAGKPAGPYSMNDVLGL